LVSRQRSDLARLSAATVLSRFLAEPVDESLLAGLAEPDDVARQSLRELISAMDQSPAVILEYLEQLAAQEQGVAQLLLTAVGELPAHPHLVTLLRMLAQAEDGRLAAAALEQLGRTRLPEAAPALASLAQTLAPEAAALAERGLRKLRLSGFTPQVLVDEGRSPWFRRGLTWRTLHTALEANAEQLLWFVGTSAEGAAAWLFTVRIHRTQGITSAGFTPNVPAAALPPAADPGAQHRIGAPPRNSGQSLHEATLAAGRQRLTAGLQGNWLSRTPTPMLYRLYNPLIWLDN
jgi:hypothetical protein